MTEYRTLRLANRARQLEWHRNNPPSLLYKAVEMAGEAGEACKVVKKLERERLGARGSRATPDDLAAELADVVICADLIAMELNLDLDAAVERKFNMTSEKYDLATRYRREPGDAD